MDTHVAGEDGHGRLGGSSGLGLTRFRLSWGALAVESIRGAAGDHVRSAYATPWDEVCARG